jgi:RNA polymerase sigma factor (sigma-70 family)
MADTRLGSVLHFLHRRVRPPTESDQEADGQLLQRFATRHDEAAFAALMHRHGPMVLGVCRRVLADAHDADDAFQATFLVLVRKAGSLRQAELLGNWLYGVAYRTAVRVRTQAAARRRRERQTMQEFAAPPADDLAWREVRSIIDEELNRLPEKYRRPFVLCHLEGLTNEEAARRLGWPKGTVLSRLSRARERLRHCLERRGVSLTTTALTALLAENARAAVPGALFDTTLNSALLFAAGQAAVAGTSSASAVAAAEGVLKTMFFAKLKIVVAVLLLVAVAGSGAGMFIYAPGGTDEGNSAANSGKLALRNDSKGNAQAKQPVVAMPKAESEPAKAEDASRAKYLIDRLASTIEFHGFDDAKMTLQDALEYLTDRFDLAFDVDEEAFREPESKDKSVLSQEIAKTPISRMRGISLDAVLRKVLCRVKTPNGHGAVFLIRRDHIEITTSDKARREAFREGSRDVPLASLVCDKRPLSDALSELATTPGVNLVIDPRVDDKAKTAVSATLLNVPADTAIRVLADSGPPAGVSGQRHLRDQPRECQAPGAVEEKAAGRSGAEVMASR